MARQAKTSLPAVAGKLPANVRHDDLPAIVAQAGDAARFAWDEFFRAEIRNPHTRKAYAQAVRQFLEWTEARAVALVAITPAMVGDYLDQLEIGPATKKLHLAGLRRFFDRLVLRHVVILNPAASVRGPRQQAVEGKTPEISPEQARALIRSMDVSHVVGLRDRAAVGIMIYTAARVGAVAKLRIKDFRHDGSHWALRFREKGGKDREIPVRADLEAFILEYLDAAGLRDAVPTSPLFRTAIRRTRQLSVRAMTAIDLGQMVKRRLADAGLPGHLSPHSFRVATITDLLTHGATLEDVQHLAGHADPRTTRLYDRRQRRITRNIVERITI